MVNQNDPEMCIYCDLMHTRRVILVCRGVANVKTVSVSGFLS